MICNSCGRELSKKVCWDCGLEWSGKTGVWWWRSVPDDCMWVEDV